MDILKQIYWFLADKLQWKYARNAAAAALIVAGVMAVARPDLVDWLLGSPALTASANAVAATYGATVHVDAGDASGTGVMVNRGGQAFVLTAGHVVEDLLSVSTDGAPVFELVTIHIAVIQDGALRGQEEYKADIVAFSHDEDLALLRVRRYAPWPIEVTLGSLTEPLPVGTRLLHVGCLLGIHGQNSFSDGVLAHVGRWIDGRVFDQTTTGAWPGSSGGGVFTEDGRYIGMLTRGAGPGFNFIIPLRRIARWAGTAGIPWLVDETLPVPAAATRASDVGETIFNW